MACLKGMATASLVRASTAVVVVCAVRAQVVVRVRSSEKDQACERLMKGEPWLDADFTAKEVSRMLVHESLGSLGLVCLKLGNWSPLGQAIHRFTTCYRSPCPDE